GGDSFLVTGSNPHWSPDRPYTFSGYDTYADTGAATDGIDRILATGSGPVDIGLSGSFSSASGIEQIVNATTDNARVTLLGNWQWNTFDFSNVSLVGGNFLIDAGDGNDGVIGTAGADLIQGGNGDDLIHGQAGIDRLNGGDGMDTFVYTSLTNAIVGGSPSSLTFEQINDFIVGHDRFDVTNAPANGAFKTLGFVSALTNNGLSNLLSSTNFVANGAATFSFGSGTNTRSFIAFNDASAGFSATNDAVIEITGYGYAAGFQSLSQISIV
ncbi:MAG: bluetail domain-containing putative surface protein, partial [Cyanobacteriota bacterium]